MSLVLALNAGDPLANEGGGGAKGSAFAAENAKTSKMIRRLVKDAEFANVIGYRADIYLHRTRSIDGDFAMAMLVLLHGDNQRPQARELQGQTSVPRSGASRGATPVSGSNILEPGAYPGLEGALHDLWSGSLAPPPA